LDVATSISTPKLFVDKIINRLVQNITVSGQLLPDTTAPAASQTLGSAIIGWKNIYSDDINLSALSNSATDAYVLTVAAAAG